MKETGTAVTGGETLALMRENAQRRFFHPLLATATWGKQYVGSIPFKEVEAF